MFYKPQISTVADSSSFLFVLEKGPNLMLEKAPDATLPLHKEWEGQYIPEKLALLLTLPCCTGRICGRAQDWLKHACKSVHGTLQWQTPTELVPVPQKEDSAAHVNWNFLIPTPLQFPHAKHVHLGAKKGTNIPTWISKQNNNKQEKKKEVASFWHLFLFLELWYIIWCSFSHTLLVY